MVKIKSSFNLKLIWNILRTSHRMLLPLVFYEGSLYVKVSFKHLPEHRVLESHGCWFLPPLPQTISLALLHNWSKNDSKMMTYIESCLWFCPLLPVNHVCFCDPVKNREIKTLYYLALDLFRMFYAWKLKYFKISLRIIQFYTLKINFTCCERFLSRKPGYRRPAYRRQCFTNILIPCS